METEELLVERVERLEKEIAALKEQNRVLAEEKSDLEMLMEMSADHADEVGKELLDKANTFQEMSDVILNTVPIPILVTRISDSKALYLNDQCALLVGRDREYLIGQKALDLFYKSDLDRKRVLDALEKNGFLNDFEVQGNKTDGTPFAVRIFSRFLTFENESCILTVLYDETERKQAAEEIIRLNEALEKKKREIRKYLLFNLQGSSYGISLSSVREITGMIPVNLMPDTPDYLKGVINLRDKIIPVSDLGQKLGVGSVRNTDRNCIIIVEINEKDGKIPVGMIVDSVSEVRHIRRSDIKDLPSDCFSDMSTAFKIARTQDDVFVIIDIQTLLGSERFS
ncbi:chemotaxis protein CheW [Desulfococcaceae bacterium HSG8]|nr:chemotaxis protein CheW [Desulfococcaceae bacterium HSG8]